MTGCLVEMRDEIKYNLDAVDILIRSGLVALYDYDKHLAQVTFLLCHSWDYLFICFGAKVADRVCTDFGKECRFVNILKDT